MSRLLLTGGYGFLGRTIMPILDKQYEITTCGITSENAIKADLARESPELLIHYDIVLHACGKAHFVPKTKAEIQAFYDVNFQGTVNLCRALEKVGVPRSFIFISTVAVYGCEHGEMITEEHPLEGTSPYAKSKIMAEKYLSEWCRRHGVILGILRPSLLAGRNAPGNLGAMVKSMRRGLYMNIDGGKAVRSILMAEDIARLVPVLAEKGGIYNVCDTKPLSFGEIAMSVARQLGKRCLINIPYQVAWSVAKIGDLLGGSTLLDTYKLNKMTKTLTFSNEKARKTLGWEPLDVLENYKI